jgi:hypothetical protein
VVTSAPGWTRSRWYPGLQGGYTRRAMPGERAAARLLPLESRKISLTASYAGGRAPVA